MEVKPDFELPKERWYERWVRKVQDQMARRRAIRRRPAQDVAWEIDNYIKWDQSPSVRTLKRWSKRLKGR